MTATLNILTHHKCASTWLLKYLSEFSNLNNKALHQTHYSNSFPTDKFDIVGLTNASYNFIADKCVDGIHLIRNPLDIVVSAYYSHLRTHPLNGWPELSKQRSVLSNVNRYDGLFITLSFLERDDFYNGAVGPLHAIRHWNFDDQRFHTLRIEDVVTDPGMILGSHLLRKFSNSIIPSNNDYTFESISGRKLGEIDNSSHYRSGRQNQWRDVLPNTIVYYIKAHYADVLERFYPESVE